MNWLKTSSKKLFKAVAIVVAGTFILSGMALAANKQDKSSWGENKNRPSYHQKKADPEQVARMISKTFGISKESVANYQAQGYDGRDLCAAGLFAKASGKSFDSVISLKTRDNSWKDVGKSLNITKEQIIATRQDISADHLSQVLKTDKNEMKKLIQNGYKPFDIISAGILSNRTGKSIDNVLSLKTINNTWPDVAASLGVSQEDFRNDAKALFKDAGMGMGMGMGICHPDAFKQRHTKKSDVL